MRSVRIESSNLCLTPAAFSTLALCLVSLAAACTTSTGGEYTKEQARALSGVTPEGDDICAMEAWYGDGICDDFCVEADEDCVTCAAVPVCGASEVEVASAEACAADSSCREVSICGATIWCASRATCLAYPSCAPGETLYENEADCPAESTCYPSSICGATVWCGTEVNCAAYPFCDAGEMMYETREECLGEDCHAVSLCGATIWCAPTPACLAYPSCGEGETAYESASDCPADAGCRASTLCGSTIWCSDAAVCEGPNPQGCLAGGCAEGFYCDADMAGPPSSCHCGRWGWECTADLGGGVCVAE